MKTVYVYVQARGPKENQLWIMLFNEGAKTCKEVLDNNKQWIKDNSHGRKVIATFELYPLNTTGKTGRYGRMRMY